VIHSILSALTALFGAVSKFFEWSEGARLKKAGQAEAENDILQANADANRIALAAREEQRALDAGRVREPRTGGVSDDPFLRD
jgi:hypothetical protein